MKGELQRVREERDSLQDIVNNLRSRQAPSVNIEEIRQKLTEELSYQHQKDLEFHQDQVRENLKSQIESNLKEALLR